jgi:hypothetical protein
LWDAILLLLSEPLVAGRMVWRAGRLECQLAGHPLTRHLQGLYQ